MKRRLYRKRSTAKQTSAALALLVLTACANSAGPAPTPQQAARTETKPEAQSATAPQIPVKPVKRPAPINDNPARIIGLDTAALDELLGKPVRVRRDNGVEIRQYQASGTCDLDAFMYRNNTGLRVSHVEVRRGLERLDDTAARACMRQILTQHTS